MRERIKDWRCSLLHRGQQHFIFISNGWFPADFRTADGQWSKDQLKRMDYGSCRAVEKALAEIHANTRATIRAWQFDKRRADAGE